jgi:SpoVK/Ycf46/Vps4 family AAA+-type ATPase
MSSPPPFRAFAFDQRRPGPFALAAQRIGLPPGSRDGIYLLSGTPQVIRAAGEAMAREFGLNLLRVDLAQAVSRYVGETERNLSRLFATADPAGTLMLFDEADALFGRRTGIRDAHDRYAGQETGRLLQRIDAWHGVAAVATRQPAHGLKFARKRAVPVRWPP